MPTETETPTTQLIISPAEAVGVWLSAAAALPALCAALALFARWDLDLKVQDRLFDFATCQWLVGHDAQLLKVVFYRGPKMVFIAAALVLIVLLLWPERWLGLLPRVARRRRRRILGFVLASMILLPGIVGLMKSLSWVPCPYEVDRYCGELQHLRPFARDPAAASARPPHGGCFPAAHPSGAFALMALYFVGRRRRSRLILLAVALLLGWLMGSYQMARGAHFLSHTVGTMLIAWPLVVILAWLFGLLPPHLLARSKPQVGLSP